MYHYIDRIYTFVPSFIRLPTSHRRRGMTCGSGIDDYLLSLVKEINFNSKKRRVGTKPKSCGAFRFVR